MNDASQFLRIRTSAVRYSNHYLSLIVTDISGLRSELHSTGSQPTSDLELLEEILRANMASHTFTTFSVLLSLALRAFARDIVFPPVSGYSRDHGPVGQIPLNLEPWGANDIPGVSSGPFAGLETFANLPYVYCLKGLKEGKVEAFGEDEKFDIAFLGAPFDTVSESLQLLFSRFRRTRHIHLIAVEMLDVCAFVILTFRTPGYYSTTRCSIWAQRHPRWF